MTERSPWQHIHEIAGLFSMPAGLFTDIDGTISEIAPSPSGASVSESCRQSLYFLVRHLPLVAAVSGRASEEARRMVGVERVVYVGNHGLDRWEDGELRVAPAAQSYLSIIGEVLARLRESLRIEGLQFEDKGATASVHYRRCSDPQAARQSVLAALEAIPRTADLKITEGRMVIELRPPVDMDKGSAVLEMVRERGLEAAVYLGDDVTDADVFRAFRQNASWLRGVGVAVVSRETPSDFMEAADYTVRGVPEVERLLRLLAEAVAGRPDS